MCHEFSAWFFKARARKLRKEQLRDEQQRAPTSSQPQTQGPASAPAQPAAEFERQRESVPV